MSERRIYPTTNANDKIKRRVDKQIEVRNAVRNEMRRLAADLYLIFRKKFNNSSDILRRENFFAIKSAIELFTVEEEDLKLVKRTRCSTKSRILHQHLKLISWLPLKMKKGELWMTFSRFSIVQRNIWRSCSKIHKNRQIKLRKPVELPLEEDIQTLRDHLRTHGSGH